MIPVVFTSVVVAALIIDVLAYIKAWPVSRERFAYKLPFGGFVALWVKGRRG